MTILTVMLMTLGMLLQGSARGGVICLGDGHRPHRSVDACALAHCVHDSIDLTFGSQHHDQNCHCTDVPVLGPAVVLSSRSNDSTLHSLWACPCDDWRVVIGDDARRRGGPQQAPPWFDPCVRPHLAVVASVRLTI